MGHAARLAATGRAEIVAGMDVDAGRLQLLEETYPDARTYQDDQALLETEELDAVCVTSIHSAHYAQTVAALEHGCHVMLEKPMAIQERHCREMVRMARQTGLILQVGFECRDSFLYRRVKEIVRAGELGALLSMSYVHYRGRWCGEGRNWYCRKESAGNLSVIETCHYIDLMRYWAEDDVEWVFATSPGKSIRTEYDYPDTEFAQLKFRGGVVASLVDSHARSADVLPDRGEGPYGSAEGSYMDPVYGHQFEYTLVGEKRSIWVRMLAKQISVFQREPSKANGMALVRIEDFSRQPIHDLVHNTHVEDHAFVANICEGRGPTIDPEDALRTHLVSFAIEQSAATREKVVIRY
jgi:predicted dehydrogenase